MPQQHTMTDATTPWSTAHSRGLFGCECCGLVSLARARPGEAACPRCAYALHSRKPDSLQRTAAYLVAAVMFYIPANVLPVMGTSSVLLGHSQHTILGGIAELWETGSWELAVIVFVASIAGPIANIGPLALLTATAWPRSPWRPRERAILYRLIETVGHWSMLDVFVVVLLVGMVRFGAFASVQPESGLLAFGAVVIATMLAASSFDPRLIWPDRETDAGEP